MRIAAEEAALHRHASGTLRAQRKHTRSQGCERRAGQSLIRIDVVELSAQVIDDRARDQSDVAPSAAPNALILEAGGNRGDRLFAVGRASGEHHCVPALPGIAELQRVRVHCAGRTAAGIHDHGGATRKADDGQTGRARLIAADAHFDVGPVEIQRPGVNSGVGNQLRLTSSSRRCPQRCHRSEYQRCSSAPHRGQPAR